MYISTRCEQFGLSETDVHNDVGLYNCLRWGMYFGAWVK